MYKKSIIKKIVFILLFISISFGTCFSGQYQIKEFYVAGDTLQALENMNEWIEEQNSLNITIVSIYNARHKDLQFSSWFVVYHR